ncbi:MAG: hypothetical protein ACKOWR_05460 [Micrococcales bacterium]
MRRIKSLRALASIAVGLFVAFWQSHHAAVGLVALAIFTILYGLRTLFGSPKYFPIALIALITSFIAAVNLQENSDSTFVLLVAIWGIAQASIDWLNKDAISASLAFLLAALFAFVPMDIVSAVGFFGAYLILSGVHLGIAAYTPKNSKK